jgi:hypothetical protein
MSSRPCPELGNLTRTAAGVVRLKNGLSGRLLSRLWRRCGARHRATASAILERQGSPPQAVGRLRLEIGQTVCALFLRQVRDVESQRGGDTIQHDDARIALPQLHAAQIGLMNLRQVGKLFLRDFLCAAMDILGDASEAIANVDRFGLSGPTRYNDIGERYLRLYGLLSATYVQQEAIMTIYRIMHVGGPKDLKKRFEALEIRQLRHKLSAHGTDYRSSKTGVPEAYVPIRCEILDNSVKMAGHSVGEREKIDLRNAIDIHLKLVIEVLDEILEKSIKMLYKGATNSHVTEFMETLKDLRTEKAGGLVFKTEHGPKLIVTFAGSAPVP